MRTCGLFVAVLTSSVACCNLCSDSNSFAGQVRPHRRANCHQRLHHWGQRAHRSIHASGAGKVQSSHFHLMITDFVWVMQKTLSPDMGKSAELCQ